VNDAGYRHGYAPYKKGGRALQKKTKKLGERKKKGGGAGGGGHKLGQAEMVGLQTNKKGGRF